MSENMLPEQDEVALNAQPPAPAEGVAGVIPDIDPERLKMMEERLKAFKTAQEAGKTESGSEAVEAPEFVPEDWEVEPELMHLYQRSRLEQTGEGPKWVVLEHQYYMVTGQWHIEHGGEPIIQNGVVKKKDGRVQYHTKGLDQVVTEIINGPDGLLSRKQGWRLSALLPGQMGQGIAVLERQTKRALPDPKPIEKPEEKPLEKVTDEELARMQEKAKEWTGEKAEGEPDQPQIDEKLPSDYDAGAVLEEGGN
jgi:hypothetical protein